MKKQQYLVTHESANGPCGRKCHHSLSEVSSSGATKREGFFSVVNRGLVCQKELLNEGRERPSYNDQKNMRKIY